MQPGPETRRATLIGTIAALLGIALFAWYVRQAGAAEIWAMARGVGWGLIPIAALGGLRFAARAAAWTACIEPPHRLPFTRAFAASVSGDAFGNLTPLGPIVGEPAKAAYVRDTVAIGPALTALAVENLFYTLSVAAMIAASTAALLTFELPDPVFYAGELITILIAAGLAIAGLMLWRRPALVSGSLARVLPRGGAIGARVDRLRALEQQIVTFASRRPAAALAAAAAEIAFHALGVAEIYVTWWLMMGDPPSLLLAFVLEGANRLVVILFKIVPLRLGVDETSTGAFTQLLGYGPAPGVTLAIVRRARVLVWIVAGTALFVRRGLGQKLEARS